jgi:hypothetical protein
MGGVFARQICLPVSRRSALTRPSGRALAAKIVSPASKTPPTSMPGMRDDHWTSPLATLIAYTLRSTLPP